MAWEGFKNGFVAGAVAMDKILSRAANLNEGDAWGWRYFYRVRMKKVHMVV